MPGPQFGATLWRMERVGEQQQRIGNFRFSHTEHRGLPSSIRMAAQKKAVPSLPAHGRNGRAETLLVAFRTATRRWPVRTQLAEGKIAAEDSQPNGAERIGQCDEKRRVAVRSRPVRQDEAVAAGSGRHVQIAADGHSIRIIAKFLNVVHTDRVVQPVSRTLRYLEVVAYIVCCFVVWTGNVRIASVAGPIRGFIGGRWCMQPFLANQL